MALQIDWKLFLSTLALIFVAELPDKTAFATLLLATRKHPLPIFIGVAMAFVSDAFHRVPYQLELRRLVIERCDSHSNPLRFIRTSESRGCLCDATESRPISTVNFRTKAGFKRQLRSELVKSTKFKPLAALNRNQRRAHQNVARRSNAAQRVT